MFSKKQNTKQKFSIRKFSLGAESILVGSIFLVSPLAEANGTSSYGDRLTAVLADPTLTTEEKSKLWDKIMQEQRDEISNSVNKGIEDAKKKAQEEQDRIRKEIDKAIAEAKDPTKEGEFTIIDGSGIRKEVRRNGIVTVYRPNSQGLWVKVSESTYTPRVTTTTTASQTTVPTTSIPKTTVVTTVSPSTTQTPTTNAPKVETTTQLVPITQVPTTSVPTTTQTPKVEETTQAVITTEVPKIDFTEETTQVPKTEVVTAKAVENLIHQKPELDINLFTTTTSAPETTKVDDVTTTTQEKTEDVQASSQVLAGQNTKPELTLTPNTSTNKKELSVVETAKVVSNSVTKENVKNAVKKVAINKALPKTSATTIGLGALTLGLGATLLVAGLLASRRKQR